jgi:hypothetical protein
MKLQIPRRGDSADMSYIEFVDRYDFFCAGFSHISYKHLLFCRSGEMRPANPVGEAKVQAAIAAAAAKVTGASAAPQVEVKMK